MNNYDVELRENMRETFLEIINGTCAFIVATDNLIESECDDNITRVTVTVQKPVFLQGIEILPKFTLFKHDTEYTITFSPANDYNDNKMVIVGMSLSYNNYLNVKDTGEIIECTVKKVPSHLLTYSPKMFDIFPIVDLDTSVVGMNTPYQINNDTLPAYHTAIYAYMNPLSVIKYKICDIETLIKETNASYFTHMSKVNAICANLRLIDWSIYRPGAIIVDNRNGANSSIYYIEKMNEKYVALQIIKSFFNGEVALERMNCRHSYICEEDVYLISPNSVIFSVRKENGIFIADVWFNGHMIDNAGEEYQPFVERVKAIVLAITSTNTIDKDKLAELYDKVESGRRIYKDRNKTVLALKTLLNTQQVAINAFSEISAKLKDDNLYVYMLDSDKSKMLNITQDQLESLADATYSTMEDLKLI